jgi:hypothetical protein
MWHRADAVVNLVLEALLMLHDAFLMCIVMLSDAVAQVGAETE